MEILYYCQKCGQPVYQLFGSGKFCSRKCSNSRVFSDESKRKKSIANKGMKAYSNGQNVIYLHDGDGIPEGYISGNSKLTKHKTIESLQNSKFHKNYVKKDKIKNKKKLKVQDFIFFIEQHNKYILEKYENFLRTKAKGKVFNVSNQFIFSQYYCVTMDHLRGHEGHVFVHILLAEALLDRPLLKTEIVHHVNQDKLDNRFDNIYVFDGLASHGRFHHAKLYWLEINEDVLTTLKVNKQLIKDKFLVDLN